MLVLKSDDHTTFASALRVAIQILAIVSLCGFYLLSKGQTNYFPTYLLGILVLVHVSVSRRLRAQLLGSNVFLIAALFAGYLALTSLWSSGATPGDVARAAADWLLVVTMLAAFVSIAMGGRRSMEPVWIGLVIAAALSAAGFLFSLWGDPAARPAGRISTKSVAAMVYGFALIVALNRVVGRQPVAVRNVLLVSIPILLGGLYFCHAHYVWWGVFVALSAQIGLYLWERRHEKILYLLLPGLVMSLIGAMTMLSVVISSQRQLIWQPIVTASFNADTLFGHGILGQAIPRVDCQKAHWIRHHFANCFLAHPHDIYISTLFYGGVVGVSLLLLCLLMAFGLAFERNVLRERVTVLALLFYGCSVLMFDGNKLLDKIDFIWLLFWLPIGAAAILELNRQTDD